jgi:hypothetical protein
VITAEIIRSVLTKSPTSPSIIKLLTSCPTIANAAVKGIKKTIEDHI